MLLLKHEWNNIQFRRIGVRNLLLNNCLFQTKGNVTKKLSQNNNITGLASFRDNRISNLTQMEIRQGKNEENNNFLLQKEFKITEFGIKIQRKVAK